MMGFFSPLNVVAVRQAYKDFMLFRLLIWIKVTLLIDLKATVLNGSEIYQDYKVDLPSIIDLAKRSLEAEISEEAVTAADKLDLVNQYPHLSSALDSIKIALNNNFDKAPSPKSVLNYLDNPISDALQKVALAINKGYFNHERNKIDQKVRTCLTLLQMASEKK